MACPRVPENRAVTANCIRPAQKLTVKRVKNIKTETKQVRGNEVVGDSAVYRYLRTE
jgi:hypothetical protein